MDVIKLDLNKLPTKALYHMDLDFSKMSSKAFAKACGFTYTYANRRKDIAKGKNRFGKNVRFTRYSLIEGGEEE